MKILYKVLQWKAKSECGNTDYIFVWQTTRQKAKGSETSGDESETTVTDALMLFYVYLFYFIF